MLRIIQEKAPYVSKAEKRKIEYEKKLKAYNKGQVIELKHCFFFLVTFLIASHFVHIFFCLYKYQAEGPKEEEESEKSVSEVNDEDEEDEDGSGEVSWQMNCNC